MADTKALRNSIISHRRGLSLPIIERAMPSSAFPSAPSSSAIPPFSFSPDTKHALSFAVISSFLASSARKFRFRSSLLALLILLTLALFAILHQHLNDPQSITIPRPAGSQQRQAHLRPARTARPLLPQISLAPHEELAALVSFMASLGSNALPETVNVTAVDPDVILDFDTRSPNAADELQQVVSDAWRRLPVVLLSKRYSPIGREIRTILGEFNLKPSPTVFDIDERADASVITPVLFRLTGQNSLPILLIGGKPVGPITVIRDQQKSGELRNMIAATSAVIDGAKKKKGKRSPV